VGVHQLQQQRAEAEEHQATAETHHVEIPHVVIRTSGTLPVGELRASAQRRT
jgi:hypothetical protein